MAVRRPHGRRIAPLPAADPALVGAVGHHGDADGGVTTTTLTTPLGSSTSYTISARGAISTTDNRVAGGNITRIEDAGAKRSSDATSVAPIVSRFEWEQNLLVKTIEGSAAESATNTTEHFYNDLRLLTKVVSPPPNDPARTDLPSCAGMQTWGSCW